MKKIILILIVLFALPAHADMVLEDFTTYTEVDGPGRFSVDSATQITITNADRDEDIYIVKDKGAAFFSADYEHWFTMQFAANALYQGTYWSITNTSGSSAAACEGAGDDCHRVLIHNGSNALYLQEFNNAVGTEDSMINASTITLYNKVIRDESVGANGTMYLYVYSDATRLILLDTLTVTLTENQDFQYLFAVAGSNDGGTGRDWDGVMSDLSLFEEGAAATKPRRVIVE